MTKPDLLHLSHLHQRLNALKHEQKSIEEEINSLGDNDEAQVKRALEEAFERLAWQMDPVSYYGMDTGRILFSLRTSSSEYKNIISTSNLSIQVEDSHFCYYYSSSSSGHFKFGFRGSIKQFASFVRRKKIAVDLAPLAKAEADIKKLLG